MAMSRDTTLLPVVQAGDLDVLPPEEQWLIEGLWGSGAIGLIGGPPKCAKTWLGLDMALSVVSGTPALGHFPVAQSGPALIYLAEDGLPQVRARIEALCRHRGCDIHRLPLHVITTPVLRIDLKQDQERLAATVAALQPRLLLLDPLVRIHRLDENSAVEISGLLGYIRDLQRNCDVAIAIVHHASKKQRSQPGQALRGSSDLHAIGDSNVYLTRNNRKIILTIEHRSARSPEPIALELVSDPEGKTIHLQLCPKELSSQAGLLPSLETRVLELLAQTQMPLARTQIRARLRINNQRLGETLARLERAGRARRTPQGWNLPGHREPPAEVDPKASQHRLHQKTFFQNMPGETESGPAGTQPDKG